jgi:hypothetical protein
MQYVSNTCNKYIKIYNNIVILLHVDYKKRSIPLCFEIYTLQNEI